MDKKCDKWKLNISSSLKQHYANIPFDVLSEQNRSRRLSLSGEKKDQRKRKIQEVYQSGKHNDLFVRYSEERRGIANPASKKVLWMGTLYPKLEFEKRFGSVESNKNIFEERDDCSILYNDIVYDTIMCPHCKKTSNKKPSTFKRWHFDNCKQRKK